MFEVEFDDDWYTGEELLDSKDDIYEELQSRFHFEVTYTYSWDELQ